jgi:hypothetical protein
MPWYDYSVTPRGPMPYVTVRLFHGNRWVNIIALVDSGADFSVMDASYAALLGLVRAEAVSKDVTTAGGGKAKMLRWPKRKLEMQFEKNRFPFTGGFLIFPKRADPVNLLGRGDFFQRYTVQFWESAELMNIDTSPDFPLPAPKKV